MSRSADAGVDAAPLGVREALGDSRAFDVRHLLISLPATAALVVLQEMTTGYPSFGWVLLSVVLQQLGAGLIGVAVSTSLRRRDAVLPLWGSALVWIAVGVVRATIGGALAAAVTGGDPDPVRRVVFWLAIVCIWMPVTGYSLAQLEHRRRLIAVLRAEESLRAGALQLSGRDRREIRGLVLSAVSAQVAPVIGEIRASLQRVGPTDSTSMAEIGARLGTVSDEVSQAIARLSDGEGSVPLPAIEQPTARDALSLTTRRPARWPLLAALGVLVAFAPLVATAEHPLLLAHLTVSVVAGAAVMAVGPLLSRMLSRSGRASFGAIVALSLAAGTVAAVLLLLLAGPGADVLVLAAALLVALAYAGVVVHVGLSISAANIALVSLIADVRKAREALERRSDDELASIRSELESITHGPIQGRLAACAMALNFFATDPLRDSSERSSFITTSVIEHLDAVSRDLRSLQSGTVDTGLRR